MSTSDRKALVRQYKDTPRPAGVFRVRNTRQKRSLVGTSQDLPAVLNRHRFQLASGRHPDPELQRDWAEFGPDTFMFEVLDTLQPRQEPDATPAEELAVLLEMWRERLAASGERLYGRPGTPASRPRP